METIDDVAAIWQCRGMGKHKGLSLRTKGIIEHMWSRGISAVSIAGETQARLDRVEAYIRELQSLTAVQTAATVQLEVIDERSDD